MPDGSHDDALAQPADAEPLRSFRDGAPLAWTYHRNTCRWPHNVHGLAPFVREGPKEYPEAPYVPLPRPAPLNASLEDVLRTRHSCRRYAGTPLTLTELSTWLHAAYGVWGKVYLANEELLERPVPSGGGLYPLELYLLVRKASELEGGVYHYAPSTHGLEQVRVLHVPAALLGDLFLGQPYLAPVSVVAVITGVLERSTRKYDDRGYRYVLLEAGHVAQNLNLAATAIGFGTLNLGGFFDDELGRLLGTDPEVEVPLYGVAAGRPATRDRVEARLQDDASAS